jgi:membrane-bound metal-dependent hydrolase YbcI (DUF457 family)
MTWKSHTAVTAAIVYTATGNPVLTAAATAGSVLPDRIEFILPWLKHRGNSHTLILWALLTLNLAAVASLHQNPVWIPLAGLALGGLLHVLEDMCSVTGVPLWPLIPGLPKAQVRVPIYKTGTISEFLTTAIILVICAFIYQAAQL